jgi:hypothetical protein
MITKQAFITKLQNEVRIIKHLAAKANTPELLNFRLSETQRSTAQWLAYVALVGIAWTKDILKDDASWFETFMDDMDNFDNQKFDIVIDNNLSEIVSIIESTPDEKFNEEKTLFWRYTDTRAGHMLTAVYNWHIAYKTQIFLQLKAAGLSDLGTMNLWGGMDAPAKTA